MTKGTHEYEVTVRFTVAGADANEALARAAKAVLAPHEVTGYKQLPETEMEVAWAEWSSALDERRLYQRGTEGWRDANRRALAARKRHDALEHAQIRAFMARQRAGEAAAVPA